MSILVKKFGGSSVATIEKIEHIAKKIFQFYQKKQKIVVVVSAMQGETDRLENLAYQITANPDAREMAALLATGEQQAISLLCLALHKLGCPARSYTGIQLGIETDNVYTKARIKNININKIIQDLQNDLVVVVAGFQGVDAEGNITTLGRGGSDTSAVALATVLQATECHIYTDVDGVYTADPNLVPNAEKIDYIDFSEMLELAGLGAKVMQIRAVELGGYYNMPIRVLSSFNKEDSSGTLISAYKNNLNYLPVLKIASLLNQTKINISIANYKDIALILDSISKANIEIDMLTNNNYELSFVVASKYLEPCKNILNNIVNDFSNKCNYLSVAKLSLVGVGLNSNTDVVSSIYSILLQKDIIIHQIVAAETKVSMLLNEMDLELSVKILHEKFARVDICC